MHYTRPRLRTSTPKPAMTSGMSAAINRLIDQPADENRDGEALKAVTRSRDELQYGLGVLASWRRMMGKPTSAGEVR